MTGIVIDHLRYSIYGTITAETSPTNGDRFKYTARDYDSETANFYYRARYYDGANGRFVSRDPLSFAARDTNVYRYVDNAPANGTDSSGLQGPPSVVWCDEILKLCRDAAEDLKVNCLVKAGENELARGLCEYEYVQNIEECAAEFAICMEEATQPIYQPDFPDGPSWWEAIDVGQAIQTTLILVMALMLYASGQYRLQNTQPQPQMYLFGYGNDGNMASSGCNGGSGPPMA